jgi:hypothetical protein
MIPPLCRVQNNEGSLKIIFYFPEGSREEFFTDKTSVNVGRANTCDVILPYEGFSRLHAQIEYLDGNIFITDLGSVNGVFIDCERIPASERTAMQSDLNLQIGSAYKIEILDDSKDPNRIRGNNDFGELGRSQMQRKINTNDQTRTIRMESLLERKSLREKKEQKIPRLQPRLFFMPLIIFAAFASYYLYSSHNTLSLQNSSSSKQSSAPVVPLTETDFLKSSMFDFLDKNKSCAQGLADWCRDAGILENNREGVVIEGKSLIIYMNMTLLEADKYSERVNSLDQNKRLEILVLRRIFNSVLIRSLSRQTIFDNVQVAGGIVNQGQWTLKVAVKIKRDLDMKKAGKFYLYSVFDQILNEGAVDRLPEIASLYEVLPIQ